MTESKCSRADLPHALPDNPDMAIVLVLLRRLASGDLHEPAIVRLAHQAFGKNFERPLTLIRAFLIETATASTVVIQFAPKSRDRMTEHELQLLSIVSAAAHSSERAEMQLRALCNSDDVAAPLAVAQVLAKALTEMNCLICE